MLCASACRNATAVVAQLDDVCRGKSQKMYNEDMKFTSFRSSKVPFDGGMLHTCNFDPLCTFFIQKTRHKYGVSTLSSLYARKKDVKSIVHKYN